MPDYRVNLEFYNGPMDLLLYLIRRDELDIYDIPISRITEQYLQYVEMIHEMDPNLAGEFLVLAATLMEIKTRMLLPSPPPEEAAEQGLDIDPRAELVRQLLEYKAFKDAAGDLAQAAQTRAQKFARRPFLPQKDPTELDMEDVQVWDLLDAFSKLMTSIGKRPGQHEVIYDDTPVELHATDILDRLQREGPLTFAKVFEGRTNRGEIVGLFIALLELVRQKKVFAAQEQIFGQIEIHLNPNPPTGGEEMEPSDGDIIAGDQRQVDAPAGQYVTDAPVSTEPPAADDSEPTREDDDEPGTETQGTAN
jgi:segregation and condensation protein A